MSSKCFSPAAAARFPAVAVMEETHWIEWIEIATADGKRYKKFLKPGDAPEADFCIPVDKVVSAREYCNLHGLWKA